MTLDRPAIVGIICGVIIGSIYIALQRLELQEKAASTQRRPVAVIGARCSRPATLFGDRLVARISVHRCGQILVDERFGRYIYCAALGSVAAICFSQKVRFSDG